MKSLAFILSIYFMMFSAQPVLAAVANMKGECEMQCGKSKSSCHSEGKQKSNNKQDPEKCPICCCNIFQCAFCCGIVIDENVFEISLSSQSANLFGDADLVPSSSYSPDCWQPPELV
jgi:hypothetical protein